MPYTPQTWVDNNASYPLSAARMNTMESGISSAASVADQGHMILTTAQRDALGAVTTGTMIYNSTTNTLQVYNGTKWVSSSTINVPPAARLRLTANVSFSNGTHGTVGFKNTNATEDYDTDGMITLSGSNSAITIKTAGIYLCTGSIAYAFNAGGLRVIRVLRNRSAVLTSVSTLSTNPTADEISMTASGMIECAANDIIDLYGYQNSGGALNVLPTIGGDIQYGGTWLSVAWVGRTS